MSNIELKICGVTKKSSIRSIVSFPEIAYIGCVHYEKSLRHENILTIRDIFKEVKSYNSHIKTVLVLVNPRFGYTLDSLQDTGCDILQLSGDEKEIFIEQVKRNFPIEIWKAIHIRDFMDLEEINWLKSADSFLLDTKVEGLYGGTGQSFNFGIFNHAKTYTDKLILSGGVNSDNVVNAIKSCNPKIIDVSSGVESSPGVKDLTKISKLIHAIKNQ